MDNLDRLTRSRVMASIKSRDTRPELLVRSYLHRAGVRFRLGGCGLPGRPDLVLPRWRTAIFVHGCFWHRHQGCELTAVPKTRADFWKEKFQSNVARDARVTAALRNQSWKVLTVWECETHQPEQLDELFWRVVA